jgi:hypothetical protein
LFTGEALVRTALDTLHLHGAFGYACEADIEHEVRDALAATIYAGTSEVHRQIIARLLGLK